MNRLEGVRRSEGLENQVHRVGVAVILVRTGETKEKARQRYLQEHPEYSSNDVLIFHFAH